MSRKDFEAIAAAIQLSVTQILNTYVAGNERTAALDGIRTTAIQIANACADSNPRFDRNRFLAACGVN
jgi:hypothetical protein